MLTIKYLNFSLEEISLHMSGKEKDDFRNILANRNKLLL